MIADLGTVRFLDLWLFSGETILVLAKNLVQQLSFTKSARLSAMV